MNSAVKQQEFGVHSTNFQVNVGGPFTPYLINGKRQEK
jgi:hypothetical protein